MHTADCGMIRAPVGFRKTYILTLRQIQQINRRQWMVYKDLTLSAAVASAEIF